MEVKSKLCACFPKDPRIDHQPTLESGGWRSIYERRTNTCINVGMCNSGVRLGREYQDLSDHVEIEIDQSQGNQQRVRGRVKSLQLVFHDIG